VDASEKTDGSAAHVAAGSSKDPEAASPDLSALHDLSWLPWAIRSLHMNHLSCEVLTRSARLLSWLLLFVASTAVAVTSQDRAPDFILKDLEGADLRLEDYRGKVVLINFWASWCGPCRKEMPLLDRLHQRYGDSGLVVLGVNVEGVAKSARVLADQVPVTFPLLIDEGQRVSTLYQLEAMPSTVVVDRDGVVRYVHRGYREGDESKYIDVVTSLIRE
jgi:peroxiredoxin